MNTKETRQIDDCECRSSAAWAYCLKALDWRITVRVYPEDVGNWESSGQDLPPFTINGMVGSLALAAAEHLVGQPQERGWKAATFTVYNAATGHMMEQGKKAPSYEDRMRDWLTEEIYVIVVSLPGCLPEAEPYAVLGEQMAWDCARNELDDEDSWPYSRDEWYSALRAGGASVDLESGYLLEVTPLTALNLPAEDRE